MNLNYKAIETFMRRLFFYDRTNIRFDIQEKNSRDEFQIIQVIDYDSEGVRKTEIEET